MKIEFVYCYTLLLVFTMGYGQDQFDSGYVEYGVKINKEIISKAKKKVSEDNSYSSNAVLKIFKTNQKIYAQDIIFLELRFKKDKFIIDPVDIMIPESAGNRFYLKSNAYYVDFKNDIFLQKFKKRGDIYIAPFKKNITGKSKINIKIY